MSAQAFQGGLASLAARAFSSLRHRNFRTYLAGQIVSLVGMWMQSAAQSWLIYELTHSKVMLGVVGAMGSLPILILSTYGGMLADIVSRRRILVATQIASSVLAAVLGGLSVVGALAVWHIVVLAALLGVVNAFDWPARQALIVDLVDRDDRMNAIALSSSVFHGTRIVGPAVAGVVMAAWGPGPCFLVNAMTYGAVITALLALRLDARDRAPARKGGFSEGFRTVARTPGLLALLFLVTSVGIFGWSYVIILPVFAADILGVGEKGYGVLMAAAGAGSVVGALTVASIRNEAYGRSVLAFALAVFSPAVFAFASSTRYELSLFLLAAAGTGLTAFFSMSNTLIHAAVSDDVRGRVMGIYSLVMGLMMPLGAAEAGGLAQLIGAPSTVRIGAVVCAVCGILAFDKLRALERRGGPPGSGR